MDTAPRLPRTGSPTGESRLWLIPLAALVLWQLWMTLGLFGDDRSLSNLLDDRPVMSGKHPLHLYHGSLGARAFLRQGSTSCYDPAFQAGYPKTPVFDGGSRPAEAALALDGGRLRPEFYKLGLALSSLLVPVVVAVSARGAGLSRRAGFLAVVLGLFVWWSRPCQNLLHDGAWDLLLAAPASLLLGGMMLRFHRKPGARAWAGMLLSSLAAWLFHPVLVVILLPLFLIYYLSVGARHRLVWSVLLFSGFVLTLGANYIWLRDWVNYWWLLVPLGPGDLLPHRNIASLWRAPLWGDPLDRALTVGLLVLGTAGALHLNQKGERATARLFGLAGLLLIVLAVGGVLNETLGNLNAASLLVPGLLFAAPLAAHALELGWRLLRVGTRRTWIAAPLAAAIPAVLLLLPGAAPSVLARCTSTRPLVLGLDDEQQQIVETIRSATSPSARILWENPPRGTADVGWTTLLPVLTERAYVGGLDPSCGIEHASDGLTRRLLEGKPLADLTDAAMNDYCRRYNIGWIVCWSPSTIETFCRRPSIRRIATFGKDGEGALLEVNRPHSYILRGRATWLGAETNCIRLADVHPENGEIVLSLHHQEGLVVSPGRVKLEPEIDPKQDRSFIRLKVDAPVAHLTLSWQR